MKVDYKKSYAAFKRTRRSLAAVSRDYDLVPSTVYTYLRGGYGDVGEEKPPVYAKITAMLEAEGCLVLVEGEEAQDELQPRVGKAEKERGGAKAL